MILADRICNRAFERLRQSRSRAPIIRRSLSNCLECTAFQGAFHNYFKNQRSKTNKNSHNCGHPPSSLTSTALWHVTEQFLHQVRRDHSGLSTSLSLFVLISLNSTKSVLIWCKQRPNIVWPLVFNLCTWLLYLTDLPSQRLDGIVGARNCVRSWFSHWSLSMTSNWTQDLLILIQVL